MEFRRGLDRLGMYQFFQHLNQFISIIISSSPREAYCQKPYSVVPTPIFRGEKQQATVRKIVYNKFIKYVRQYAAGRRIATLKDILIFVTCADEIPILGFAKQPFISFHKLSIPEIERKEKAQDDQVSA